MSQKALAELEDGLVRVVERLMSSEAEIERLRLDNLGLQRVVEELREENQGSQQEIASLRRERGEIRNRVTDALDQLTQLEETGENAL